MDQDNKLEEILCVQNLTKYYGKFKAVDDISFKIHAGEIFALLGPNGAGKTSTLECIEGIRKISEGTILIDGLNSEKENKKVSKIFGVQLQASALPEVITVEEAINMFSLYSKGKENIDILKRFDLVKKQKTQFRNLSIGQQKKLAIAIALSNKPKLLILDEPTAALDVNTRVELHKIILEEKEKGTAILLASHDMSEVCELADNVAILLDGKIVALGSPMDIITKGNNKVKILIKTRDKSLLKSNATFEISEKEKQDYTTFICEDIEDTLTNILSSIKINKDKLLDIIIERKTLEERFIDITKRRESNESFT